MVAGRRPALLGVDLVDLTRRTDRAGLARRILAVDEVAASDRWAYGIDAHLALKEALIKAAGGRPPDFRWQHAVVDRQLPRQASPRPLRQLVESVAGAALPPVFVRCRLEAGLSAWAQRRLSLSDPSSMRCTGAWARLSSEDLVAFVLVYPSPICADVV